MNVHDTVRQAMIEYPLLFASRTQVLHHLFWVNGNGYEWLNGELVDYQPHKLKPYKALEKGYGKEREKALEAFSKFVSKHDEFVDNYKIPLSNVYPICEYACIMNIPDDVKPDWLEAARESLFDVRIVQENEECNGTKEQTKKVSEYLTSREKM